MAHSYRLRLVTWRYQARIPVAPDICHSGCAYIVLQTVQRHGVYSAAYGTVHYKEPLKSFEIRVGHSPGFELPSVAILPWLFRKRCKAIFNLIYSGWHQTSGFTALCGGGRRWRQSLVVPSHGYSRRQWRHHSTYGCWCTARQGKSTNRYWTFSAGTVFRRQNQSIYGI